MTDFFGSCLTQVPGVVELTSPSSTFVPFLSSADAAAAKASASAPASSRVERMNVPSQANLHVLSVNAARGRPARAATSARLPRIHRRARSSPAGLQECSPFRTDAGKEADPQESFT